MSNASYPAGTPECGAKKRQGEGTCSMRAGWGTDHPGTGKCRRHGGSTASHRAKAARAEASLALLATFPDEPIEPHDALQRMLDLSCSQVDALADLFRQHTEAVEAGEKPDAVTVLASLAVLGEHMERVVRFSKVHLDAGVAERQTRIAERYEQAFADFAGLILGEFGLRDDPRAADAVERAFVLVQGGLAA